MNKTNQTEEESEAWPSDQFQDAVQLMFMVTLTTTVGSLMLLFICLNVVTECRVRITITAK